MIAAATRRKSHRANGVRLISHCGARAWLFLAVLSSSIPAFAEIGATLSISSDNRLRGRSLSARRPTATLDFAYDSAGGAYLGASFTAVATARSGVQFLGAQQNIGYAARTAAGLVIDAGIVNSNYTGYFSGGRSLGYTEAYLGIVTKHVTSHVYYSPNYFRGGVSTIYADLGAVVFPAPDWRLSGHAGLLTQVDGPRMPLARRSYHDWRVGLGRRLGRFDLQLIGSGGGPGPDYYEGKAHDRNALVLVVTYIL